MKFCACIDTLYTELPWEERFAAAKRDGFESVEFWDWRTRDLDRIRSEAETAGINISGFNGDADYSLVDPEQRDDYIKALTDSAQAAKKINADSLTIHSNALGENGIVVNAYENLSDTVRLCSMYEGLRLCAQVAQEYKLNMNLEGLNIKVDHAGNFLKNTQMAAEVAEAIGSPYIKILYDAYHMQINEGDICGNLKKYVKQTGHIHIADTPGRHEPGTGEINYRNVIACLGSLGYDRRIGFELFPKKNTSQAVEAIMKLK